jgi:hypothetical protein
MLHGEYFQGIGEGAYGLTCSGKGEGDEIGLTAASTFPRPRPTFCLRTFESGDMLLRLYLATASCTRSITITSHGNNVSTSETRSEFKLAALKSA